MKRLIKLTLSAALFYSGMLHFVRLLNSCRGRSFTVLTFHRITDDGLRTGEAGLPTINVAKSRFEAIIDFVCRHYSVISLQKLIDLRRHGASLPVNSLIISFDDGYKEVVEIALPVLRQKMLPSVLFVPVSAVEHGFGFWWDALYNAFSTAEPDTSGRIEGSDPLLAELLAQANQICQQPRSQRHNPILSLVNRLQQLNPELRERAVASLLKSAGYGNGSVSIFSKLVDWQDLRACQESDMAIGSHTVSHEFLTSVPAEVARHEVVESKKLLESALQVPVAAFSYPGGRYDDQTAELVAEAKYECAFTSDEGLNSAGVSPFRIKRINVSDDNIVGPRGNFSKAIAAWSLWFRW